MARSSPTPTAVPHAARHSAATPVAQRVFWMSLPLLGGALAWLLI